MRENNLAVMSSFAIQLPNRDAHRRNRRIAFGGVGCLRLSVDSRVGSDEKLHKSLFLD